MSILRVLLLGSPEVSWDGQVIQISRRIPRAIFYYLAANPYPIGRAQLISIFWPDNDDASAREMFRDNLSKLRASLPVSDLIVADQNTIKLDRDQIYVDALDFQNLAMQIGQIPWRIPLDQPLPEETYQLCVRAVELWRSPQFLASANFSGSIELDNWLSTTEQNLIHTYHRLLDRLIIHCAINHDYSHEIQFLNKALLLDQLNDGYHLDLIKAMVAMGQKAEALKHGLKVQSIYKKELGELPSREITDFVHKLSRQKDVVDKTRPTLGVLPSENLIPFVGRDDAIARLSNAYRNGEIVQIQGDKGVGKTRLIQELHRRSSPKPRLLAASCHEVTKNIPYQPLIEMIRSSITADEISKLKFEHKRCLSQIAPELRLFAFPSFTGKKYNLEYTQKEIFEAFSALLELTTYQQKALLVLDEAQWADRATWNVLNHLISAGYISKNCILILTMSGPENNLLLSSNIQLNETSHNFSKIELLPLSLSETIDLVQHLSPQQLPPKVSQVILDETGGIPEIIVESMLATIHADVRLPGLMLTGNIREIFNERFQKLSPIKQSVLSVAAVCGNNITLELLENVSQLSTDEVVTALEELEALHILSPVHSPLNHTLEYRFSQNMFREVILLEMSQARNHLLHRRIGKTLENFSEHFIEKNAAILADHFEKCGDLEKAFEYWMRACLYALSLSSKDEEMHAFHQAELLLPSIEMQMDEHLLADFHDLISFIPYLENDSVSIEAAGKQLLEIGQKRSSSLLQGMGLGLIADGKILSNQLEESRLINEQCLRMLDKNEYPVEWLRSKARQSVIETFDGNLNDAKKSIDEAFDNHLELDSIASNRISAITANVKSTIHAYAGYPLLSLEDALRSQRLSVQSHHLVAQLDSHALITYSFVLQGQSAKAMRESEIALDLARQIGYKRGICHLYSYRSMAALSLGKLDSALEEAKNAIKLAQEIGFSDILALAYRCYGDCFRFVADYPSAVEKYEIGLSVGVPSLHSNDLYGRLGYLYARLGDITKGRKMISDAKKVAESRGMGAVVFATTLYDMGIAPNNPDLSTRFLLQEIYESCRERGLFYLKNAAAGQLSRVLRESQEFDASEKLIVKLAADCRTAGDPIGEINSIVEFRKHNSHEVDEFLSRERVVVLLDVLVQNGQSPEISSTIDKYKNFVLNSLT